MTTDEQLFTLAAKTRENSYSPISQFKVGAAILTATGNAYGGTNIEEAGLNSTIHAEQCAIAQMIAQEGRQKIVKIVVVGGADKGDEPCAPCGHCRQMLGEFASSDLQVISYGPQGDKRMETTLGALLPHAFRMNQFL